MLLQSKDGCKTLRRQPSDSKNKIHLSMMLSILYRPNARHRGICQTAQPVLTPVTYSSCTEPSCLAFGQRRCWYRCWGSCCVLYWRADCPQQIGTAKVTVRALQARGEARDPADQRDVLSHIPGRLNNNQMADKARTSRALEALSASLDLQANFKTTLMQKSTPPYCRSRKSLACRRASQQRFHRRHIGSDHPV